MKDLIERQAAIDALDTGLWGAEWDKALATAMLEDLPPAQPEKRTENTRKTHSVCLDTISRNAAIEVLGVFTQTDVLGHTPKQIVEALPSAQPETHEKRTETHACDCISRQAAIDAINKIFPADPMRDDYTQGITCGAALANIYVGQLPSAQPEIIYCKDCVKHNKGHGRYLDGTFIGIKDCCPLVEIRGMAQGHEFDYQYCVYAERRTDGEIIPE